MFRSIFHPDSALMITMGQITDCIFLSLFWLLGCFPLVTAGASTAALYDAVWRCFRLGEKHPWHRFGHSFRRNLKSSILPSLILLPAGALLLRAVIRVWNSAVYGQVSWAVFSACAFAALLLLGMGSILFPMLSRFENPTGRLFANTARLGMARLPLTLGLGLLNAAAGFVCIRWIFPLFFLPALTALLSTLCIEPMFRPFMPDQTE